MTSPAGLGRGGRAARPPRCAHGASRPSTGTSRSPRRAAQRGRGGPAAARPPRPPRRGGSPAPAPRPCDLRLGASRVPGARPARAGTIAASRRSAPLRAERSHLTSPTSPRLASPHDAASSRGACHPLRGTERTRAPASGSAAPSSKEGACAAGGACALAAERLRRGGLGGRVGLREPRAAEGAARGKRLIRG